MRELNIDVLVNPDMSKASDNNYKTYVENFNRIVNKHLHKIDTYRNNHPGYKLGFLIFDEAPGYIQVKNIDKNINMKKGAIGKLHFPFRDQNLMKNIVDADLDFVIWMTPFKNFPPNPPVYPKICVIDLKKFRRKVKLLDYDEERVVCIEI